MVAPFVQRNRLIDTDDYYSDQRGYTQSPPYDVPLRYERRTRKLIRRVGIPDNSMTAYNDLDPQVGNALLENCYEKFKGKLSDSASLGASLAELGESVSMITTRLVQLRKFTSALRKGNIVQASAALGLNGERSKASPHKTVAANWLEFHFGWSPLMGDIHDAINVLQSPVSSVYPSASSQGQEEIVWYEPEVRYKAPRLNINCGSGYYERHSFHKFQGSRRVSMRAEVRVTNSNLWLANQLGLINPLSVAWEVVPFSFVVDWFTNVGQFLNSATDFYGLTLDKASTTYVLKGHRERKDYKSCHYWGPGYVLSENNNYELNLISHMIRSPGISKPGLFVRPLKVWGWQRAATAASLLIAILGK